MNHIKERYHGRQREEDRKFWCVLYPDSTTYDVDVCLNNAKQWEQYYYILHDKDTYSAEDVLQWSENHSEGECPFSVGDLKKPHYHLIVCSSYPKVLGLAAISLGLKCTQDDTDQSIYVERVVNVKQAVRYISHIDHPEKFQYSYKDIFCNKSFPASRFFIGADLMQECRDIYNFIYRWDYNQKGILSYSALMQYLLDNSLLKSYIRNQVLFNKIIDANNFRWKQYNDPGEADCPW